MKLEDVMRDIRTVLDRSGFMTTDLRGPGVLSFNMVSRRDDLLLLIKVIERPDDLSRPMAGDILNLARVLKGSPLLLVPSSRSMPYQDGVLYIRFGIPLMTLNTLFDHLIEEVPPMIYHGSGGFFVTMDGSMLNRRRESLKLSLGALADAAGVSRRAIQMYESGMGADIEVALRLESVLSIPLILPLDPFSYSEELQSIRDGLDTLDGMKKEVFSHLDSIGLEVIPARRCPFDALARGKRELLLTSVGGGVGGIRNRAGNLKSISSVTGCDSVMVVSDSGDVGNIGGTPVLRVSEVRATESIEELVRLIRERA